MQKNKQQLISEITEAFKGVTLEEGIGLSEADAVDSYSDLITRSTCRKNDEKNDWSAIPSALLNKYYCSLSFFDAKGMRFHLPAYLIATIKGEYNFGMSFSLTHLSDYSRSQFELLSTEQRAVVKLFLESLLDDPDQEYESAEIKKALETYWKN